MTNPPASLQVAKLSDTGRARSHNEDYVDHYVPRDPDELATRGAIYLVADGMGGHQAGEVASRAAAEMVIDQYYRDVAHDTGSSLVRAIKAANRMIYEQAQSDPAKGGMGTTLVAAVIAGSKVYVASVGDSRVYLISPGRIAQITEDHSWVQEQVRAGLLTPDQARQHPQRNVVTRALGSKPSVEVDLFEGQLGEGDSLLLCTDGLSGLVEDRELQAVVQTQPPEEAVRTLVAMANERGGTDNISVVLVSNRPPPAAPAAAPAAAAPIAKRRTSPLLMVAAVIVALAALAALGQFVVRPLLTGSPTLGPADLTQTAGAVTGTAVQSPLATPVLTVPVIVTPTTLLVSVAATAAPPTVTRLPTRTATTTPEPAVILTRPVATGTRSPTSTSIPTYKAVTLVAPKETDAESLHGEVTFVWSYDTALKANEAFQVLIWKEGTQGQHLGAAQHTTDKQQKIDLDPVLRERGGAGVYRWTVVVVRLVQGQPGPRLSPEGTPRKLTFIDVGGGQQTAAPGATTTNTPRAAETGSKPVFPIWTPLPTWTPLPFPARP